MGFYSAACKFSLLHLHEQNKKERGCKTNLRTTQGLAPSIFTLCGSGGKRERGKTTRKKKIRFSWFWGKKIQDFFRKQFLINIAVSYKCTEHLIVCVHFLCQEVNGIKYITRFLTEPDLIYGP